MEPKRSIEVGDSVQITMITKEGVARQRFIPKLDTIYQVVSIQERAIQLQCESGTYTYLKGSLRLKIVYNPVDVVL